MTLSRGFHHRRPKHILRQITDTVEVDLRHMKPGLLAGFFYFLILGVAGVSFGILREMFVTPMLGRSFAILLELPFMLLIAWVGCRMVVRLTKVPEENLPRIAMGVVAFGLLMAMEQSLQFAFNTLLQGGRDAAPMAVGDYIGLAGQIATGLFPLFITEDTEQET